MQNEKLHAMRHTAAHVLAAAAQRLYPNAKFGVGPVIENGFYYDILFPEPITEADLRNLEKEMQKIIKEKHDMVREEMSIDDAISLFKNEKQDFKVDLLTDLKEKGTTKINPEEAQDIDIEKPDVASIYRTGDFVDLCRGPHLDNVGEIGAFKIWKLAGAYWRGNEENDQLQRIYGLVFETREELKNYQTMLEEAKKRDHRKLGAELDLFSFSDLVGPGLPLFSPRGAMVREKLTEFVWELMKPHGYTRVCIPHMAKCDLYKTSGHWDKFADDIFHVSSQKTDTQFVLKPMNCPHHTQIYASKMRSYRDLPLRYSEVTAVYRDENTGQLQGLSRVRSITQDDAHVFCRPDQVKEEALKMYDIVSRFYAAFNMPLEIHLSAHDPDKMDKYLGTEAIWEKAEGTLKEVLENIGKDYKVDIGEAAFYGPKIDFIATDAIGREWQLATIQIDFNLPERFELEYVDSDGKQQRPVMLHRAILGSVERFMGVLIEHYAGAFPMWLAPEQIRLATVSEDFAGYAKGLLEKLRLGGVRVELDDSSDKLGKKIRNAAMSKIPWTIVIGEKEVGGGDFKINVFGSEEDLSISQDKIIDSALKESKFPV
ncbi:MAG: threonine--tRNA ligase [Candidatus Uhrbacteria bacterium]|nr:threonine--tRNA ligase [Candidatus Uhrbacteria bacterium]